ncbi:MAG: LacI family DNA-binding transcriptional regulator [Pseudomonadota bacterium]
MKSKKTLQDVAAAAGVSKMTASRALRGDKDVSSTNIQKVRKAAREIGYFGNHLAASLSSKRSDLIGVVVPSLSNIVFPQVMSGVTNALVGTGFQPVFGVTDYDPNKENEILRNMLSWRPGGLIVTGLDQPEETRKLLLDADVPIVQIMDVDGTPVDSCVGFSHAKAGQDMATAILAAGRKRIAYAGCNIDKDTRAQKRRRGFVDTLNQHGQTLVTEKIADGLSSVAAGRQLAKDLSEHHPDLDCIYFSNDDLAIGGLSYCIDAGIAVPKTMVLVGFNGLELLDAFPGKVVTSRTSRQEIGETAANLILASLKGARSADPVTTVIEPEVLLGDLKPK